MKNKQRGVVLIITMVVLVLMCLAALALMKTDSLSTLLSGTVASRSAGNAFTFSPLEDRIRAIASLVTSKSTALNGTAFTGYSPVYLNEDNEKGIPRRLLGTAEDLETAGNVYQYSSSNVFTKAAGDVAYIVVERLCNVAGITNDNMKTNCAGKDNDDTGGGSGGNGLGKGGNVQTYFNKEIVPAKNEAEPFQISYRITIRVDGANGARSFTQAFVYI
jgi:hypothetical protein